MMTALTIRPFIAIVLAASGFAAQDSPPALSSDGEGGLRKDGKPFRAIGVNYFSCFYRTLLDGADTSYEQGFEVLAREGIPFVRFAATGFCPTDMALYRTDREEYFRRFYDTRGAANRDEYRDVSESKNPEIIAARKRFEKYLQKIPLPDEMDPSTREAWKRFRASPEGAQVKVFRPAYLD